MKIIHNKDFTQMTIIASLCGMIPYEDHMGQIHDGVYTMNGLHAPVDLSAANETVEDILKTAIKQLSEKVDESYNMGIEKDFLS